MKIGIITNVFKPPWNEGTKKILKNIADYIELKNDNFFIISDEVINSFRKLPGFITKIKLFKKLETIFIYRRVIKQQGINALFKVTQGKTYLGIDCFLTELFYRIPYYIYITSMEHSIFKYNFLLNQNKVFVGGKFLKKYFPDSHQIYPPIDLNEIIFLDKMNCEKFKNGKKVILFLGAFQQERGVDILINAVSQLYMKSSLQLILAWNGYGDLENHIKYLIKKNDIESITTILGTKNINGLYNSADIVVIPRIIGADIEQMMYFPLRIIEAMAFKKPIVVSNIYELDKEIDGAGITCTPGSVEELKNALEKLITDQAFYDKCSEKCGMLFQEVFHPLKSLSTIHEVLHKGCNK